MATFSSFVIPETDAVEVDAELGFLLSHVGEALCDSCEEGLATHRLAAFFPRPVPEGFLDVPA